MLIFGTLMPKVCISQQRFRIQSITLDSKVKVKILKICMACTSLMVDVRIWYTDCQWYVDDNQGFRSLI